MLSTRKIYQTAFLQMARVFAVSDLHVDIKENLQWVDSLSNSDYTKDVLIVAGDVTDDILLLKRTLKNLKQKFVDVCFVPGNHELWIRPKTNQVYKNSFEKFQAIIELCENLGVHTQPVKVSCNDSSVWIVPLFSWYTQPEEDSENTLYVPREIEDKELTKMAWMDNHFCVWTSLKEHAAKTFSNLNENTLSRSYDAPVISFSHFVPRFDLIPASETDLTQVSIERRLMGLQDLDQPNSQGANIKFNFSRYAGCKSIERQIRQMKSNIHIFGHQHRNRDCVLDGIRYVSFCLGYPRERAMGLMWGLSRYHGPKQVWPSK